MQAQIKCRLIQVKYYLFEQYEFELKLSFTPRFLVKSIFQNFFFFICLETNLKTKRLRTFVVLKNSRKAIVRGPALIVRFLTSGRRKVRSSRGILHRDCSSSPCGGVDSSEGGGNGRTIKTIRKRAHRRIPHHCPRRVHPTPTSELYQFRKSLRPLRAPFALRWWN